MAVLYTGPLARIAVLSAGTDVGNEPHRIVGGVVRVEFPSCRSCVAREVDGIINHMRHVLTYPSHRIDDFPRGVVGRTVCPQFLIASSVEIDNSVDVEGEVRTRVGGGSLLPSGAAARG